MNSGRLILFLVVIILIVAVLFSGNRIGLFLRSRFNRILPAVNQAKISPTPTVLKGNPTIPPSFSSMSPQVNNQPSTKGGIAYVNGSTSNSEIPATGPGMIFWTAAAGGFTGGIALIKVASRHKKRL